VAIIIAKYLLGRYKTAQREPGKPKRRAYFCVLGRQMGAERARENNEENSKMVKLGG
jgi:hypothetical protein